MIKSSLEPEKRRKYVNKINVYINIRLKEGLGMEFTAC